MRKFTKFLIPALLVVAVIVSCVMVFASAEDTVIYVSSTGTGDGSSASSPIGPGTVTGDVVDANSNTLYSFNGETYAEAMAKLKELKAAGNQRIAGTECVMNASPLYRAFEAMGTNNGTIVIMDEVALEVCERLENGSAADFRIRYATGKITITSNYGGTDYRANGAKFVFDQTEWSSINLWLSGPETTWKDLDIVHNYNSNNGIGSWSRAAIYCGGNTTVFDTGLTVKTYDYATGSAVEVDPVLEIFGGARYQVVSAANVTVKSGTWANVYGAGHGLSGSNTGAVNGDAVVNIEGGTIGNVYGVGSLLSNRKLAFVGGNLTVNVTGGEIANITALTATGVKGEVAINVAAPAKVGAIAYNTGAATGNVPTSATVTYEQGTVEAANIASDFTVIAKENVVYVSANGTGDGSSPQSPLGNANVTGKVYANASTSKVSIAEFNNTPYADALAELHSKFDPAAASGKYKEINDSDYVMRNANALYRAFQALNGKSGTIVIVGPVSVDVADRMTLSDVSPGEFALPETKTNTVKLTSVYDGTDYASTNGARLVLDRSVWNSINLQLGCETVWENLTVEHKQEKGYAGSWAANAMIYCSGYDTEFGAGIKSVSTKANGSSGGSFPFIFAGTRYKSVSTDSDGQTVTIKSGIWHGAYAAGHGMNASNAGIVTGNVTLNIENAGTGTGTNVVTVSAGGFTARTVAGVNGDVTINVKTGARVQNDFFVLTGAGVSGNVTVNVDEGAVLSAKDSFNGLHYSNGNTYTYTPASVKLNFYTSALAEADIYTKAEFEAENNEYNILDAVTPPPSTGGTPAVTEGEVIYVSSNGTGDGSSPDNPIGHADGYEEKHARLIELIEKGNSRTTEETTEYNSLKAIYKENAFYRALTANNSAIIKNGGAIVIVGELSIDAADGARQSFSEFQWPGAAGTKTITLTSYYNGVDYRTEANGGAKLVLDTSVMGINLRIKAPTVWEYLNIEAKYDTSRGYGTLDDSVAMISFFGNKTVIDEEVAVTANDVRASGTKRERYPTLVGYDRLGDKNAAVSANPDITINSGTWGTVYGSAYGVLISGKDQYGSLTGNVTVTVNGGKISELCGTSRITSTTGTAAVTGNVTIAVNGGEVAAIYGTNHMDVNGKITVTVAKEVTGLTKAWGAYNEKTPTDATITYDRAAITDDKVDYWTVKNPQGEAPVVPPVTPTENVVYISATGTGDGSSPQSPLGNTAGYTVASGAEKGNALYLAFQKLSQTGGTIVVVGDVAVDAAESRVEHDKNGKSQSPSEFRLPAAKGKITITSVYNGVDYRTAANGGAEFILDQDACATTFLTLQSAVTFENLNIVHKYDPEDLNTWGTPVTIAAYGNELVIGENVDVTSWNVQTNEEGDFYPSIVGGHRYINFNKDTNVTIKSGTWETVIAGSFGMANYGKIDGDAVLNIEGGTIETVYGTSSLARPYASITGKLTINVTGGKITELYGASTNGAENEIVVNIAQTAERVNKAWGYPGTGTAPANASITYDRSVIRDDEVKYWTNTTAVGNEEDQPEKEYYTVYVADVARGKGDGSSPENAIGATADYWTKYAKLAELLALPSDQKTDAIKEEIKTYNRLYTESALYRALNETDLFTKGGKLVLVGPVTVNASDSLALPNSNGDFNWNSNSKAIASQIIITSVDKGVDYREQGAKFIIDRNNVGVSIKVMGPTIWENLDIEYRYNSKNGTSIGTNVMIWANGNEIVFGEGLKMIPVDSNTTKSDLYPNVVGGHRYSDLNGDFNITIKSGTFSTVLGGNYGRVSTKELEDGTKEYTTYGNQKGSVTITVEGGKITTLVGTARDDSSTCKPILTGDVNIDIKGDAEVVKLYGANRYGIDGKITVNVTENSYVGTAWGYHYTSSTKDAQPTDATLNYVRSAIFEADVKYWTVVNASGEGQPGVHGPVIYIATTSRGTGDGSSPENAMGNAADYNSVRAQALAIIKANGGTNSNLSKENSAIVSSVYKKSALYLALSKNGNQIVEEGGTIVVCEPLVINSADAMRRSLSDFRWPTSGTKTIYFTSKYDGVDYRWKGAKVVLDCVDQGLSLDIKSPTNWDNIVFEHRYNSENGKSVDSGALLAAGGNKMVIGYNVSSIATDVREDEDKRVEMYPSICGGGRYSDYKQNTHVTVNGGKWAMVVGGTWTGSNTGSTTIGIGGGKIGTVCGTGKPTNSNAKYVTQGSVWIGLWAGEVDNVYGVGKNGLKWGSIGVGIGADITINGKVYATHPDYEGDTITAIAYYSANAIDEDKLIGFTSINPQTGSALVYLAVVAAFALVATGVVISKKRKRIED